MAVDPYNPSWNAYKSKVGYQEKIYTFLGKHLVDNYSPKPVGTFESMLSIGHGEGDMDIPLISNCLTGITKYYGVDPRESTKDPMKSSLAGIEGRAIKVELTTEYVEKYGGPPGPVDFILVGHVMYYVVDEFISVMEKLLSWLSPGGCLVLSHIHQFQLYLKGERITGSRGIHYAKFLEERERCKKYLKNIGWTVEDNLIGHQFDFSGSASELELMMGLMLGLSDISPEEMNQLREVIEAECTPGSKFMPYDYEVSLIYK